MPPSSGAASYVCTCIIAMQSTARAKAGAGSRRTHCRDEGQEQKQDGARKRHEAGGNEPTHEAEGGL